MLCTSAPTSAESDAVPAKTEDASTGTHTLLSPSPNESATIVRNNHTGVPFLEENSPATEGMSGARPDDLRKNLFGSSSNNKPTTNTGNGGIMMATLEANDLPTITYGTEDYPSNLDTSKFTIDTNNSGSVQELTHYFDNLTSKSSPFLKTKSTRKHTKPSLKNPAGRKMDRKVSVISSRNTTLRRSRVTTRSTTPRCQIRMLHGPSLSPTGVDARCNNGFLSPNI